ncbi:MAG: hypothetical protein HOO96_15030 [Polyangiaceae bacterium]|nr:hypothetical protein [Polyangiaceae bacterium]
MRVFSSILCLVVVVGCSSDPASPGGTSSGNGTSSGSSTPTVVDKVAFDTKGCIGSAASETQVCYDWAYDYALTKTAQSSSACQSKLACKTAQRGCRLYVDCGAGVPPVCTDLDPKANTASANVPYAGETYACSIGYTAGSGGRRLFNLTCKSPKFNCVYAVD